MLNQLLGGHYRVIKNLGQGGLAKTYIVEDYHRPGHPQCVAKFLNPTNNDPNFLPTARRLFHQEAEILEKLGQHDQIPQLLAYFEQNQEFYLVQEFIEGHTLSLELKQGAPWSESQVIWMLQDVLPILEFVHDYGVIHRDIKPNNLIRRQKDGRLVLIDFGAVKQIRRPHIMSYESLTENTISIGTQGYVPIEQIRGKPRFNSDIYALGIIAIQALTGVIPFNFTEDHNGELIWQHLVQVSDELATILSKMVRYHFPDRYQSATEVMQALQSMVHVPSLSPALVAKLTSFPVNPENQQEKNSLATGNDFESILSTEVMDKLQPLESIFPTTLVTEKTSAQVITENQEQKDSTSSTDFLAEWRDSDTVHFPLLVPDNQTSRLLIGGGIISIFVSIFAGCLLASHTYINHRINYLKDQKNLDNIEALKEAKKYQECLQQAQVFSSNYSKLRTQAQTLWSDCQESQAREQLTTAKELAQQSRFQNAIALVNQVSPKTELYSEAQQLISQWSEKIFQIANNKYQEGNLQEAIAIAKAIPSSSSWAKKAEESIQQWNQDWNQNQAHLQVAQKAIEEGRWQDAIDEAKKITKTPYWQRQSELIIHKAQTAIARIQVTSSTQKYQPNYISSVTRKPSNHSRSQKSVSRNSSNYQKSSPPKIQSRQQSTIKIKPSSRSTKSPTHSTKLGSNDWICLNNPNPKCR
jgi:serine/threonine-protein kinase